jgi:hypothetical protein
MKNGRLPQKNEMEDNINFKAVLLRLFNNKNLKKNGFDTIEIDLVADPFEQISNLYSPLNMKPLLGLP